MKTTSDTTTDTTIKEEGKVGGDATAEQGQGDVTEGEGQETTEGGEVRSSGTAEEVPASKSGDAEGVSNTVKSEGGASNTGGGEGGSEKAAPAGGVEEVEKKKPKKTPKKIEVEEFYVKYRSFSYLHAEWRTEEELFKGDKRVVGKIKRFKQKRATTQNMLEFVSV